MSTKYCGKDFLIQVESATTPGTYVTVGGLSTNGLTINNEAVDITDKGDMPWRVLLANCGLRSISMKGDGMVSNDAVYKQVQASIMAGTILNYRMISGAGDRFQGAFLVTSFQRNGDKNNAEQFSASFESSGVPVYTAAP